MHTPLSRRAFLAGAGAAAVCGPVAAAGGDTDDAEGLIIDTHAHIYSEDEQTYPPMAKPYRPPPGKGTIAHLRRELKSHGVRRAVAVHTFTYYQWDNRFVADAARDNRDAITGVCLLDPDNPQSPELLKRYVEGFNIRGLRCIPAKSGRLDDPGVDALW